MLHAGAGFVVIMISLVFFSILKGNFGIWLKMRRGEIEAHCCCWWWLLRGAHGISFSLDENIQSLILVIKNMPKFHMIDIP